MHIESINLDFKPYMEGQMLFIKFQVEVEVRRSKPYCIKWNVWPEEYPEKTVKNMLATLRRFYIPENLRQG